MQLNNTPPSLFLQREAGGGQHRRGTRRSQGAAADTGGTQRKAELRPAHVNRVHTRSGMAWPHWEALRRARRRGGRGLACCPERERQPSAVRSDVLAVGCREDRCAARCGARSGLPYLGAKYVICYIYHGYLYQCAFVLYVRLLYVYVYCMCMFIVCAYVYASSTTGV